MFKKSECPLTRMHYLWIRKRKTFRREFAWQRARSSRQPSTDAKSPISSASSKSWHATKNVSQWTRCYREHEYSHVTCHQKVSQWTRCYREHMYSHVIHCLFPRAQWPYKIQARKTTFSTQTWISRLLFEAKSFCCSCLNYIWRKRTLSKLFNNL